VTQAYSATFVEIQVSGKEKCTWLAETNNNRRVRHRSKNVFLNFKAPCF
jgi:hypothetical protein